MNSLRIVRVWWVVIVLAAVTQSAFAKLTVYFEVTRASWWASHIVVVETTPIDGAFDVVESWKGDLAVGSRVVIPELIPPASSIPISGYPKWWRPDDQSGVVERIPKQPVGSRIVLFLTRKKNESGGGTGTKKPEWSGWATGTGADSMKISAVWVDGDITYSFTQLWNTSSPLVLFTLGEFDKGERRFVTHSEEELKRSVEEVLLVQNETKAAIAETNGRERALRLKSYVSSKIYPARMFALEELGKAGPGAVSTIGEMLDDPAFAEQSRELIRAMVQAGGDGAGSELNRRLEAELAFWKTAEPTLSRGWWNRDSSLVSQSPLQARYGRTYELIYGVELAKYKGALNTAIQMRDLWRTIPLMDERDDRNQIV